MLKKIFAASLKAIEVPFPLYVAGDFRDMKNESIDPRQAFTAVLAGSLSFIALFQFGPAVGLAVAMALFGTAYWVWGSYHISQAKAANSNKTQNKLER